MSLDQTLLSAASEKAAFDTVYREAQAQLFRRNVLFAAAVFMAFICWDVIVAPMSVRTTLGIRLVFLGFCMLLFIASGLPSVRRWYNWYYVVLLGSAGVGVSAILWYVPQGFAIGIAGVLICIAASSAIFRANAWSTALAGVVIALGTIALMMLHGEPEYLVRSHAIFLVAGVGFALLHSVQAERTARQVFQAQERLESEKSRSQALLKDITTMRAERLTWLENLARFLRHELKNQIVAMGTSIDLAQTGDSLVANRVYLDRAQRSLNRMRGLVSSATEATSLEAALAVDETEQVDLSALVADRVLAFQQLHPSRQLVLRLKPGLFVQGNEERLMQLLDKLLNNAVEHSVADAEIRVTLRRLDNHEFELTVENDGDPLPKDKERIFEAFVSSQKRPENLGLGLFVAQSIAQNHGGHIVAEDLPGSGGARFVLRLPEVREQTSVAVNDASAQGRVSTEPGKTFVPPSIEAED
ncbi:MAG: HAMP domain-containing histidine kinase [Myxococcales bacterium]|nr:HAMP domain-containing histidine kinase [Myxococcales bacterium]MDH3844861.1 HAMP domain-containing histidine kinase [Myxococcales bacterium]